VGGRERERKHAHTHINVHTQARLANKLLTHVKLYDWPNKATASMSTCTLNMWTHPRTSIKAARQPTCTCTYAGTTPPSRMYAAPVRYGMCAYVMVHEEVDLIYTQSRSHSPSDNLSYTIPPACCLYPACLTTTQLA
jgi:hypothetical protein